MTITHIQGLDNGTCETHTHQWRHTQVETLVSGIWRLTLHAIPCFDKGGHFHMKMFTRTWTAHEDNVHDQQTKPTSEGQFPFFHHVQLTESIFFRVSATWALSLLLAAGEVSHHQKKRESAKQTEAPSHQPSSLELRPGPLGWKWEYLGI